VTITEFSSLDPTEFHLVPSGATGFGEVVAKAADGAVGEVLDNTGDLTKARWAGFCAVETGAVCKERFGAMFDTLVTKARLKTKQRNALPDSAFALPESRAYPIHDLVHAHKALELLHNASPKEQKRIKAAVHTRFPEIQISKEGTPQSTNEHHPIPSASGSESQTRENHPHMGAVHMDVTADGYHVTIPPFTGFPAPTADQEGHGSTAPNKTLPMNEAKSQTQANARKEGSGDGRGDPAPNGDQDLAAAQREARTQTDARMRKEPGDPAWEAHDAELAERAGTLIDTLAEREKAEGAQKGAFTPQVMAALQGLVETGQKFLSNVQTGATKEIEDMTPDELVKMLDERDEAARLAKQAKKDDAAKAEAKKAKMKAKMKAKAKAMADDPEMAEKLAAKAAKKAAKAGAAPSPEMEALLKSVQATNELVEKMSHQPQQVPVLNQAGIMAAGGAAAFTRGPVGAQPTAAQLIKQRGPGEPWSVDQVRRELAEKGIDVANLMGTPAGI